MVTLKNKPLISASDFETTVYKDQERTDVWAAGYVELWTEDVKIFNCIEDYFSHLFSLNTDQITYFHNLKFDGAFILSYLLTELKLKQACKITKITPLTVEWLKAEEMENDTFKYLIAGQGQWYSITIKHNDNLIEIRDSLKLLPFTLKRIGESFKTKHQKTTMEYVGYREPHGVITNDEREYISNDVLVLKEGLEKTFEEGHDSLTIGSCCLKEFKEGYYYPVWRQFFPNLAKIEIDKDTYGSSNADEYIRKSYKGGWCYVVKEKEKKIFRNGVTLDVNSLYPSVMSFSLGYTFPIGKPKFYSSNREPKNLLTKNETYFFIRLRTRFKLKENMLPTIQIKNSFMYNNTEYLTTSDVLGDDGEYYDTYINYEGKTVPAIPELTLSKTDYILFKEHYELYDTEYLDYCTFVTEGLIFDKYLNKYKEIKQNSTGAVRELAKLFLNNLYGKMATNTNSSFKYALVKDGRVVFTCIPEKNKKPVYIPIGSAITSYARDFTIRTAQKNYYGPDKRGFIYADTDSIHCDLSIDEIKGVKLHNSDFGCWKCEGEWDEAIFTRQKTYIEHIVRKDGVDVEPFYDVKCAGMPPKCKDLFVHSMMGTLPEGELNKEEKEFLKTKRTLTDFDIGLKVPSKLRPVTIIGGVVLVDTSYEMR